MLFPKYFGKLSDIYQLNIIRPHLWKIWVCSSWGQLRSHYPVFLGSDCPFSLKILVSFHNFLISFIISWKCEACSWWVEIYPEMGTIYLVLGPNSTKFRRADRMDFIPLANPNMFGGSNLLRKMGGNYPSGALCLKLPKIGHFMMILHQVFLNNGKMLQHFPVSILHFTKFVFCTDCAFPLIICWPWYFMIKKVLKN